MTSKDNKHEHQACELLSTDLVNYYQSGDLTEVSTNGPVLPSVSARSPQTAADVKHRKITDELPKQGQAEPEDLADKNYYNRQRERVEEKVATFFEKICKNTIEKLDNADVYNNVNNTIHYGNVANSYDADARRTSVTKTSLLFLNSGSGETTAQEDQLQTALSEESLNLIKLIEATTNAAAADTETLNTKKSAYFKDLNLVKKSSLTFLIERNRENKICCPFDEIADFKFKKSENYSSALASAAQGIYYDKLTCVDLRLFEDDDFMPNCVSSLLTLFFFDVFQPSEIKQFTSRTIDILLKMKNSVKPRLRLNETSSEELFLSNLVENCLWNCFALFKFRFNLKYKNGFLNYLISTVYFHNRVTRAAVGNFSERNVKVLSHFKQIISFYAKALFVNGLVEMKDLGCIVEVIKSSDSPHVDYSYLHDFLGILVSVLKPECPMRLSDSCRILVKQRLKNYDVPTIKSLGLAEREEQFLLFNSEFEQSYEKIQSMLI